ncbi:solute carrier organic anion transporter family member 4A1-like [Ornithodoros turicata]|uniref:solute carrier organic anion transporter family member 4A1-like n=1 Tax=Ornithodoros turicata TaxID=34597 RepID=UPI0031393518
MEKVHGKRHRKKGAKGRTKSRAPGADTSDVPSVVSPVSPSSPLPTSPSAEPQGSSVDAASRTATDVSPSVPAHAAVSETAASPRPAPSVPVPESAGATAPAVVHSAGALAGALPSTPPAVASTQPAPESRRSLASLVPFAIDDSPYNTPITLSYYSKHPSGPIGNVQDKGSKDGQRTASKTTTTRKGADTSETAPPGAASEEGDVESDPDVRCGFLCVRYHFLERFRTPGWLLLVLCSVCFMRNFTVAGIMLVVLPTLERRYQLTGSETGTIVSTNDMAGSLLLLPVSFMASNRNKPHFISAGITLIGLGNTVITLAHTLAPPYQSGAGTTDENCPRINVDSDVHSDGDSIRHFRFVILFGQVLAGIGATATNTVAVAYLVENVPPEKAPAYVGIFNSMLVLGPSVGFIFGGMTLKYYVDIFTDYRELGITPSSGSWVGAWWIGFFVAAVVGLFLGFAVVLYPRRLPRGDSASKPSTDNVVEWTDTSCLQSRDFGGHLSDLPSALLKLTKNLTLDLVCLARSFLQLYTTGITSVVTKFLEAQFALTSANAALLIGPIALVAGAGGAIFGGVMVSKLKLGSSGILRLCLCNTVLSLLGMLIFWFACPDANLAVNAQADGQTAASKYEMSCNSHCGCIEDVVQIVCSADNKVYLSPCYAGCQITIPGINATGYSSCACIEGTMPIEGRDGPVQVQAVRARCKVHCGLLIPYLLGITACLSSVFLSMAPSTALVIRVVRPKERALALGLIGLSSRLLGSIPAPVVFGTIVDSSCAAWKKKGGQRGNCLAYHNIQLAHGVFFTLLVCVFGAMASYAVALYKVSRMTETPGGSTKKHVPAHHHEAE